MSVKIMNLVWGLDFKSHARKLILLALADNANDEGYCWPNIRTIAKKSSVSERWVSECISELVRLGFLEIQSRSGKSNYYKITPHTGITPEESSPLKQVHPTPEATSPPPPPLGSDDPPHPLRTNHKEPSIRTINEPSKTPKPKKPDYPILPDWLPPDDWKDFCDSRKTKVTPRAAELIFKKLEEYRKTGDPPGEVLQQSIRNGWTGIFPLKRGQNDKHSSFKPSIHQPSEAATEVRRRGIADALARRMEGSGRPADEVGICDPGSDNATGNGLASVHGSGGSGVPGESSVPLWNTG